MTQVAEIYGSDGDLARLVSVHPGFVQGGES